MYPNGKSREERETEILAVVREDLHDKVTFELYFC